MPRETPAPPGRPDAERPFAERRDVLFEKVVMESKKWKEEKTNAIVGRVFEHSLEDGIRLADRLAFTPAQYRDVLEMRAVSFPLKHPKVFGLLLKKINHHLLDVDSLGDADSLGDDNFRHLYQVLYQNSDLFGYEETTSKNLGKQGSEELREEQKSTRDPVLRTIDDLYLDVLTQRTPKLKVQEREGTDDRSKGEVLAGRYLDATETILEKRFYTGPVKDMFPVLARDPLFHHPTVLESDLLTVLKRSRIQADAALTRLEPARVVAYSQLDTIKRGIAERELVKELKDVLPEGKTVALDREAGVYRVEDEPGADKTREKSEPKSEAERMAEFEERVMDEMERLLLKGIGLKEVLTGLAGMNCERAWDMRKRGLRQLRYNDVANSLIGVDTEQAWEMRREIPDKFIVLSVTGLDSPRAWQKRYFALAHMKNDPDMHREVVLSLSGVDSDQAWELRKELIMRGAEASDVFYSLAGLESERAWKMRERIIQTTPDLDGALDSLAGLDSERAWKMREKLKPLSSESSYLTSLAGLDSERAWKARKKIVNNEGVAYSLAGLDTHRAWRLREELAKTKPNAVALGLAGDSTTFVWRLNPELRAKIGMEGKEVEKKHELTTKERLAAYEKKMLDILHQLMDRGVGMEHICAGLVGFDSGEAWKLRQLALSKGERLSTVVRSLAGIDSPTAWSLRENLLEQGDGSGGSWDNTHEALAESLAGLDSERAWNLRGVLVHRGTSLETIVSTLNGLDSKNAWAVRKEALRQGVPLIKLISGLSGVDSREASDLFDDAHAEAENAVDETVAINLASLDSLRAWNIRDRLLDEESPDYQIEAYLLPGLAGVDSDRAWQLRKEYLKKHSIDDVLVESLAGLDSPRAWQLREEALRTKNASLDDLARSMNGTFQTFVWRLRKEPFEKEKETTGPWQEKLRLLNLVHDPTLEGIQDYHTAHPFLPPQAGLSQRQADVLSGLFSDRSAARALLATNAAIPDRAPERLADALFRRMAPGSVREPSPSFGSQLTSAFNTLRGDSRPSVPTAVIERTSYQLFGGGSENLSDTRTVLEAREAADELLVKGAYGRYNVQKRTWEKIYFPVRRDISGPTKETTLTLTDVAGAGRISLPLSLDARLIVERVKGVTRGGKEVALEVSLDSLGQASVQVPPGVTRILYSVEQPLAPEPLHDSSPKEFEGYLRTFQREHGKDMTAPLARLPHDVEAEVKSRVFQALSPKQKMVRVEALVREVGWYDTRNEEVSQEKLGKTPEEHIAITEERLESLKGREKPATLAGKKFAGVCTDFALITATLLRKAGFPAGIMSGLHLAGKTAQMRDMHATAFVPWPDGRGGIRLVAVDGTPSSAAEAAAGIARPSLGDLEDAAEQATDAYVAESKEVIDALLRSAGAHDIESIRKLKNSKLENALNIILRYEVKQPHLRVVEGLLNAYWYGGLAGQKDRLAQNIQLRGLLEAEVARARSEPAGAEGPEPAGTRLLQTTRDFLSKFQRGGAAASTSEAFDLVERVAELAKGELSDVEHRALVAVITYLRAEKMR